MFVGIVAKSCTFHNVRQRLCFPSSSRSPQKSKNERMGAKRRGETTVKHVDKKFGKKTGKICNTTTTTSSY